MPRIPNSANLNATSVDILNAIRNSASANYRDYVPVANPDQDSIREIGAIIMDYPALQNEFLTALVNRIGRVIITNKSFENPWAMFKKGILEFGETVEEIFVNIAQPFEYDVDTAETEVFKREIPDVRAAFHVLNYQKFYKATIQNEQLRQAFLSWTGITDLISKIVDSMYTGANYDEFLTMKYLLAKHILNGHFYPVNVGTVSSANMKSIAGTIKGISNNLEFPTNKYNVSGVTTRTAKEDQYLIVNANFDAMMDVEVLAAAFNMDKAEFMGHRVLIDSFGQLDTARLDKLFEDNQNYTTLTAAEIAALDAIPAVVVDRDWFMIFDNIMNFTEQYNGQGLYWNYWYHVWKTFSVSPFANNVAFVGGAPSVTSVEVSPATASVTAGQSILFTADVETTNFAPKSVNWKVEVSGAETDYAGIDIYGNLSVADDAPTGTEFTITATSTFDETKTDTATVTVV